MTNENWTIEGSMGETIVGTTHIACGEAKGVVLMAHGFKGYKDYGMFPWLASHFAKEGYSTHRFNFSNSGMLDGDGPFERPDLFEQSTWNRQVEDLKLVADRCTLEGLPLILFGHSRGGVATLLSVGRGVINADRVISLSAPCTCLSMSKEAQEQILRDGYIESPSGRTGQMLHVGKIFLEEQLQSPEDHDLCTLVSTIDIPCLIVHGEDDLTVSDQSAITLSASIPKATLAIIPGGDHVFNTTNPFPLDEEPSSQLKACWKAISDWIN